MGAGAGWFQGSGAPVGPGSFASDAASDRVDSGWVGSTAAATHLKMTGAGAGDCIGTREQTLRTKQRTRAAERRRTGDWQ